MLVCGAVASLPCACPAAAEPTPAAFFYLTQEGLLTQAHPAAVRSIYVSASGQMQEWEMAGDAVVLLGARTCEQAAGLFKELAEGANAASCTSSGAAI